MMGGSGMPTPSTAWLDTTLTDYIDPATGDQYTPVLVPTPESFAATSLLNGLADLQAAMANQQTTHPGGPYLVEGYSQSAVIAVDEKMALMEAGRPAPDVTFLLLGSLNRPDGGIIERFPGFSADAGIPTIDTAWTKLQSKAPATPSQCSAPSCPRPQSWRT